MCWVICVAYIVPSARISDETFHCERHVKLKLTKYMDYLQGFHLLWSHLFSRPSYPKIIALCVNYGLTRIKFAHNTKGSRDHVFWGTASNKSTVFLLQISGNMVGVCLLFGLESG